jgi:hypothetical protein
MAYTCKNVPPTGTTRLINTRYIYGFEVVTGTDIDGKNITGMKFNLRAEVGATGTLYCRLYQSSSTIPTVLHTFGSVDVSSIADASTFTTVTFDTSAMTGTISGGYLIGLEYSSTSAPNIYMEVINSSDAEGLFFEFISPSTVDFVSSRSPYYCYNVGSSPTPSSGLLNPPQVAYI